MADPKIRYDILANVEGEAAVEALARELEKLDSSFDPAVAGRAKELAAQLRTLGDQQSAVARFVELKTQLEASKGALRDAQSAAQQLGQALSQTETPTRSQTGQMAKLGDAVRAAKADVIAQTQALDASRAALSSAGISTEHLASEQRLLAQQEQQLRTAATGVVQAYQQQGTQAEASAAKQVAAHRTIGDSVQSIGTQLQRLQTLAGTVLGGQLLGGVVGDLAKTSDAFQNLQARVKLVTGEGAAFQSAWSGVIEVANRTNSSLEATGELFTRIAEAGKTIGLTNADALRLTESINQALTISGASAESSSAAVTQLLQGLQSGVLRGDEFNSVMEQAPRLAKALADGLGVTTGELRKLAEAGQLTSTNVIAALQGQSVALQREFATMPLTIGRAIQSLTNAWTVYIGEAGQASGASATVAKAIVAVAHNLDTLAAVLFAVGKVALAYKAISLGAEFLSIAGAAAASTTAITAKTVAVIRDTEATVANAVAQRGSTAALVGAAAGASRFASLLGSLKLLSVLGIALNFREIGTAIGEGVAKLQGYGKASEELALRERADVQARSEMAAITAQVAQQMQIAADKAFGLNDQSRKLIGTFDEAKLKGEETAVALAAVGKALELGDLSGIKNGITALDALEAKGKVTGAQLRDTLSGALKDVDLNVFATNAAAAFDKTEAGARRLKDALDAIATESLRRAGTSLEELTTGFSTGATKAVNDVDALSATLVKLGITGDDAARVLGAALDKATEAAGTERAVRAVMDRFSDLGKQGLLTGQQVSDGLAKAQEKIDSLTPGIKGLAEAARKFGTDVPELITGVSKAFSDSVTEVDRFGEELVKAKVSAERASPILADALDKRIVAAKTREELELLRQEIEKLGASGKLMGDDVTAALDKTKAKAIELTPAMQQLKRDAETLGIKIATSTSQGADKAVAAYDRIKASGKATGDEVQAAFIAAANASIKASGGIVPEWVKVESATRKATVTTDEYGNAVVVAAKKAGIQLNALGDQVDATAGSFGGLKDALTQSQAALVLDKIALGEYVSEAELTKLANTHLADSFSSLADAARNASVKSHDVPGYSTNKDGSVVSVAGGSSSVTVPEGSTFDEQRYQRDLNAAMRSRTSGGGGALPNPANYIVKVSGTSSAPISSGSKTTSAAPSGFTGGSSATSGTRSTSASTVTPSAASTTHAVSITIGSQVGKINTASANDSAALVTILKTLESSAKSAGY